MEDPAMNPGLVITDPGEEYACHRRRFQGIPGIERTPGGRLWAVWYAGGPDQDGEGPGNYVVAATSDDDGYHWSEPKLVIAPPGDLTRAFDPVLWLDPYDRLWLLWAQSQGLFDGRAGVWCIMTEEPDADHPKWTAPRRIGNGIMMNKPTVTADGEWLLPISVWSRGPGNDTPPHQCHHLVDEIGSNVWVSIDQGRTFSRRGSADVPDRRIDEHMMVERLDRSLWMLVRTNYGIGESVSKDGGRTWSAGGPSRIPHVTSRFFIRRLSSGKLLLVRHNPPGLAIGKPSNDRSHLTAYLSDDDGATWYGGLCIDERLGVSYPDGIQSPDGRIYITYDFSRKDNGLILLAVFTEADVAAGRPVSDQVRLRVLINQASFVEG